MKRAGLIALALMIVPALAQASLININTADAILLDTLPGIGPTYAARIVDYRTAHGSFTRIEDIQNVSGIGPSTYADIKPFITVGDPAASPAPTPDAAASSSSARAASPYVPPPSSIMVDIESAAAATLEVPIRLTAHVTQKGGTADPSAQVIWSFGDGSSLTGTSVEKTYRYVGTYLVTVTAIDGPARAHADLTLAVKPALVRMLGITDEGVTLSNDGPERLELSGWRLLSSTGSFRFPEGTAILPGASVLFPFTITNLPFGTDIALLYPNGITAARLAEPAPQAFLQPDPSDAGLNEVQAAHFDDAPSRQVETITSAVSVVDAHAEGVVAPAAAVEPAAAGAAPAAKKAATGIFRSPWTLSLLGVIAAAGGAFILL